MTHRIKHQHPAEEVDSFMGCLARQSVQNRKGWLQTKQTSQHQPFSPVAFFLQSLVTVRTKSNGKNH